MNLTAEKRMIKHTTVSGIIVALLVAGLVYCISPGEVETAWSMARNRVSAQATEAPAATLHRGTRAIEEARQSRAAPAVVLRIAPDPFRPFGSRPASPASRVLAWLRGPQAIAAWMAMAALWLAARYAGRKRFSFATQQKMAITLSKAVRQM
jgi:hypothetical protein